MDVLKPVLSPIVRLDVSHRPLFHIAGVQHNKVMRLKREATLEFESKESGGDEIKEDDSEIDENREKSKHLDTWA